MAQKDSNVEDPETKDLEQIFYKYAADIPHIDKLIKDPNVQRVEKFTTGSGINNTELGVRLRYDIRRGFSPYVGVSFDRSFGETATLIRQEGGTPSQVRFAMGLRAWF